MSAQCPPRRAPHAARQRGQAMLLTVLLLGVGVSAVVYNFVTPAKFSIERDRITVAALAQAREALIGRAAADATRPGSLSCPDIDNDGDAESPVAFGGVCPGYIGRLPWKTLGLPDLRDGYGERLWYALTPAFRDHSTGGVLNSDTPGQLTITGSSPASGVIAIIFAPGPVVGAQVRDAANQNNVANYLEGENANGDTTYASAVAGGNDKLLPITHDALFPVVEMRVLRELRNALRTYRTAHGYFPSANLYTDPTYHCTSYFSFRGRPPLNIALNCTAFADWGGELPAWFGSNEWQKVTYYSTGPCRIGPVGAFQAALDAQCTLLGDPKVDGAPVHALVFTAGRALPGQDRVINATLVPSYLDLVAASNENQNDDPNFISPVRSATNNDRLIVVWP